MPVFTEIGLDSFYRLVVVVTDSLELVIEICQSDVVVHRSLVDSDDLHFSSENHRLDESCPLFHSGFSNSSSKFPFSSEVSLIP